MNKKLSSRLHGCTFILSLFLIFFFSKCSTKKSVNSRATVFINYSGGKYTLIKNGLPYFIKGASGHTYLKKLKEIGGNTIRIYDTAHLKLILDEAQANNIAVIAGLPVTDNKFSGNFYTDTTKVKAQFTAFKNIIKNYKNHPALLMWCVGNELDFDWKIKYVSFYHAYNNLVAMIHNTDQNHPVTTTIVDAGRRNIFNIMLWTKTDAISINSFGGLKGLPQQLRNSSWFWKGPYMILEWGIKGPWRPNEDITSWESYIESTSSKKAEQYLQTYKEYIPLNDPRLLGSFVFYWGYKQEYTHTWYSLFDEKGYSSEAVDIMQKIWTGKSPAHSAPAINYMLVDNKGALDNIIYKPGKIASAEIRMIKTDSSITNVKWEIYHEDWYIENNKKNLKKLVPIDSLFIDRNNYNATFSTPLQEGPYRLFGTVYNRYGNFATCNTPFYVVK